MTNEKDMITITPHLTQAALDDIFGIDEINSEKFTILKDPNNSTNWGIIWETSGTQGGFTSEAAARKDALKQDGIEATADEATGWEW